MKPEETEVICLISYEITQILLGGGPEDRVYYRNKTLTLEKDALLLLRKSTWI